MTTQRVHTSDDYDVYGGRSKGGLNVAKAAKSKKVGKVGWLGNPYKLQDYDREKAIELYERDLTWLIEGKLWFRHALRNLYGSRISCTCPSHMDCHVDILVSKINELYWDEHGK